jgi:hypothetical protein
MACVVDRGIAGVATTVLIKFAIVIVISILIKTTILFPEVVFCLYLPRSEGRGALTLTYLACRMVAEFGYLKAVLIRGFKTPHHMICRWLNHSFGAAHLLLDSLRENIVMASSFVL